MTTPADEAHWHGPKRYGVREATKDRTMTRPFTTFACIVAYFALFFCILDCVVSR